MRRGWPLPVMAGATALMVVGLLSVSGCVRVPLDREVGEFSQAAERVEIGDALRADVTISMGAGELFIDSGRAPGVLLDADYTFRPSSWEPEVTYEVRGERGVLEVRQPRVSGLPNLGRGVTNRWDLVLAESIPLALDVNLGAGKSELVLGGLDLRELSVATGAGDVLVDLSGGEFTEDLRATIEGGAGAFRVRVPADVGVRVIGVRDGLGSYEIDGFVRDGDEYVNSAYGRSVATIELRISRGVGETVIEEVD